MSGKTLKLTKAIIADAQPGHKEYIYWDTEVRKLGLRVLPTGNKSFIYQYRIGRLSRKLTLGPSALALNVIRELAQIAASKVARGIDPGKERDDQRNAISVAELAQKFEDIHIALSVRERTGKEYLRALKLYILPALGSKRVADVTRTHIFDLHSKMRDKPTQANRTLEIISKMFSLAEEWGFREPGTNPRKGVKKYPETKRERFLSAAELQRVGEVLAEMEVERIEMPSAIAAARLLMFTGCRLSEILTLQWDYVDFDVKVLRLPFSKTGKKNVQLTDHAIEILRSLKRAKNNPWVLIGRKEGGHFNDLQPFWQRVRARAGLNDVRIHDLRHTFASVAAEKGWSLHMIGKLLGHSSTETTKRYAHLAAGTMQAAASDITATIAAHMNSGSGHPSS